MAEIKDFVVNGETPKRAFFAFVDELLAEKKYITFSWRIGESRSLDQNALFHVWCTEYAAHLLRKDRRDITAGELDGMKRVIKREYYLENGHPFMVHVVVNPRNTRQSRREFTSSSSWRHGEMFHVLTWMQQKAAHDGLILESKGQFAENQRRQVA